ncbi:DUF6089 family protein [Lewinella sp. W8]|uniref:DUF6089 family protein n=1 Tax=Lewinella sp. W8 TaxID=2528208 RepID=UPI0010684C78|nr:DUF6089 family protein [Lewinella sp. W8]MTB52968.1 hypothetical protein [Lewinella sp. W8]
MRLLPLSLVMFCCFVATSANAQYLELGVKGGVAVYSGDLSPAEFGLFVEDMNFAGGAYLRYRPTDRFGVRVNGNFGRISAERETTLLNENNELVPVSRNFRSRITEFNLVAEYDLFYIGDRSYNHLAAYIYGGVGVLSYNPEGELDGTFYELQPLRTEGQGLDPTRYAAAPYELTRVIGILGGGIRYRFGERIVLGLEGGIRYTGTDYLDDIGDTEVRYLDILELSPEGSLAARFSNPAVQNVASVEDLTYRRGGEFNDYYFVGGLTLGIIIGEGGTGRGRSGCYNF